ncbi:putative glycoside hydrolase [Novipirellula aureliae]|nr:putative glycoside hydrolase [Novipirellula aureliae]
MKKKLPQAMVVLMILLSLAVPTHSIAQESQKTDKATAWTLSDGSQFVPKSCFPEFSWETTPMYYHFGDIDRVLKPEEVKFISERTGFICIEKSHGFKMLGDAVLGAKHEADAFHEMKPDTKVLYYFNSLIAWPFTQFNKEFTPAGIAKNPDLKEFLIRNSRTGELQFMENRNGADVAYSFNALNPEFRTWWIDSVMKGLEISDCDGVFIDRMNVAGRPGDAKEKVKGEMMAALRERLGPDKILLGNNAADNEEVFSSCDAFMFEHAKPEKITKENILKEWGDLLRVAKAGKISVYRFGVKGGSRPAAGVEETPTEKMARWSREQFEFYQACYLIGAQPYSYFQFNWGWNLSDGNLVDYPGILKRLGPPKDAYKRVTPDGWEFTREFEHASIWVDTDKRTAKITWR